MVQTSNPCWANVFITEYSPWPGGVRSKLVRDEFEDPCTRNRTGSGASPALGAPGRLRNMFSETLPFLAQYSLLQIFEDAPDLVVAACARFVSNPAPKPIPAPATILRRDGERSS